MQTYVVTLKVDFEDGWVDEQAAADFVGEIVRQIGQHTIAKKVIASVEDAATGAKMAYATWNEQQNKLMVVTDKDLNETRSS